MKAYRPRDEAQSCDANGVKIAREGMPMLLADEGTMMLRDVYNMDETGMYLRKLASKLPRGRKKDMVHLTFMLYCSADHSSVHLSFPPRGAHGHWEGTAPPLL